MSLVPGARLGPYEIVSLLGAGGMGEVYRARDTRLDRSVALKVMIADRSGSREARERFEQEARAISSLSHPHICALFDVGHEDETDYLVMEYLEGESLAARLAKGPLPLDQVLRLGVEIADALDRAHRQGIIHRDLKPANVMLTRSGSKLLDFGLAKLRAKEPGISVAGVSGAPTLGLSLTGVGVIVGTLAYMSPEQLEAKPVDARTDLFALGAILYEMTTGKRAFSGANQASLIAAILTDEIRPLSSLRPDAPPALERVIRRCLAKDPEERWQSARDVVLELRSISEGGPPSGLSPCGVARPVHAEARSWLRARLPWGVAALALALAGLATLAAWKTARPRVPGRVMRFALALDPPAVTSLWQRPVFALSPDGSRFVYVGISRGRPQLFLRDLGAFESTVLPGTEEADGPFFSPDGKWVGFFAESRLKKISLAGGLPVVLCFASPVTRGASWAEDDTIVFALSNTSWLFRVPAAGGAPAPLTSPEYKAGEQTHRWPDVLPGGKAVLFTVGTGGSYDEARIAVQQFDGSPKKTLIEKGTNPRYVPTGHIVFARGGALLAAPFDLERLDAGSEATPVLEKLRTEAVGVAHFSLARNGSVIYLPGPAGASPEDAPIWVDRRGTTSPVSQHRGAFIAPRLSPDGRRLAILAIGANQDVWLLELGRASLTRLTLTGSEEFDPVWTPDGARVAYTSERLGRNPEIFWKPADGSGEEEKLTGGEYPRVAQEFSRDGRFLAFTEIHPETSWDLWILSLDGDRKPVPFLRTPFAEAQPTFSVDGRWIAYTSNESGRFEIYVQPHPGPGRKIQVSPSGGIEPLWSRDGRELFYRSGDRMLAVPVRRDPDLSFGTPMVLFESRAFRDTDPEFRQYDAAPDGRFVMIENEPPGTSRPQLRLVLNWFSELSSRAPTRRK